MLFKYRGLLPFEYFVDTLAKRRLYASQFDDQNDPMEERYLYESFGGEKEGMDDVLKDKKQEMRVCSLSRRPDYTLMWSHYADGNRGVVSEVDVDSQKYDVRPIKYTGPAKLQNLKTGIEAAKDVLSYKLDAWRYEDEVRVFEPRKHYVDIELLLIVW